MAATPVTQKSVIDHLTAADFELRVAAGFECLKNTPAHDSLKAAVAQVAIAREWVREKMAVEQPAMTPKLPPVGIGLPLTRKERLGYRWP